MQGFVQTKHLDCLLLGCIIQKASLRPRGGLADTMDTPSGKERIAPLIYWSKGILREDMQEFLIGKLCLTLL